MPSDTAPDDIVRLATAANPFEANVWRQALEKAGIRCQVVGEYLEASIGDVPGLYPEVWVHQDDLGRAQEILRQGQEVSREESGEEAEE